MEGATLRYTLHMFVVCLFMNGWTGTYMLRWKRRLAYRFLDPCRITYVLFCYCRGKLYRFFHRHVHTYAFLCCCSGKLCAKKLVEVHNDLYDEVSKDLDLAKKKSETEDKEAKYKVCIYIFPHTYGMHVIYRYMDRCKER